MPEEEKKPMTVIVWFPESEGSSEESKGLLRKLREAGLRAFAASFPKLRESNLFVGDSVYSGDEIDGWLKKYIAETGEKEK